MANVLTVSEDTFETEVITSATPVLVDFSAVWCGPCKMLDPIIERMAVEWEGKVKVVKIDADQNPNLLTRYGVLGIPTLLLFKDGVLAERVTGYQPKDKLTARFARHLQS
ncbi:MAG: thioredoxin [Anaerolineales bacterium]